MSIASTEWKDGGWRTEGNVTFYRRRLLTPMSRAERQSFALVLLDTGWIVQLVDDYIYWGS